MGNQSWFNVLVWESAWRAGRSAVGKRVIQPAVTRHLCGLGHGYFFFEVIYRDDPCIGLRRALFLGCHHKGTTEHEAWGGENALNDEFFPVVPKIPGTHLW